MTNRPLVYFWKAYLVDGSIIPQFDSNTYSENAFSVLEQDKLVKFGLYPFDKKLAKGLRDGGEEVVSIPFLSEYEINLDNDKRLIYYRDVFISQEEYHLCKKCKKEFKFNSKDSNVIESKYQSPICPNCSSHDLFICKACGKEYKRFEDAPYGMCQCGSHLRRERITSGQYNREKRWINYILGYQILIGGINHKMLMCISENGNSKIL